MRFVGMEALHVYSAWLFTASRMIAISFYATSDYSYTSTCEQPIIQGYTFAKTMIASKLIT